MSTCDERPKVAVAQYAPEFARPDRNLSLSIEQIRRARRQGADIVVLPELCLTGIRFRTSAELRELADTLDGPACSTWKETARDLNIHIIAGFAERSDSQLFNSVVHLRPNGSRALYRKGHFFGQERSLFDRGDRLVMSETPWGKIGFAICYDLWFPEIVRALASAGASMIAVPANWFTPLRQEGEDPTANMPMGLHLAIAAACSNEVTIACASRTGEEEGVRFLGRSAIIGPNGRAVAGPGSFGEPEVLVGSWSDPMSVRRMGQSHLAARRPELYDALIECVAL